jgi:adenosylcobinamide-GDP ribazoletransferase
MSSQHPIRDAGLALSLLTAIPTPARWPADGRTQVAGWFPAVGALVGLSGYAVVKLAETTGVVHRAPFVVAAVVVTVWALITRMLHWDGLADVADGYWGSHDVERRLEIMSDSHTGAFGATAVALVAVLEVTAIGSFLEYHQYPVLAVPLFARFAATAAAWLGKSARPGGLGDSVMGRPSLTALAVCTLTLSGASLTLWRAYGYEGLALAALALVVATVVPHVLSLRFRGVTGDVMGASVLLAEALTFAAIALAV